MYLPKNIEDYDEPPPKILNCYFSTRQERRDSGKSPNKIE